MDLFLQETTRTLGRIISLVTDPNLRTYWLFSLFTLVMAIAVVGWQRIAATGERRFDVRAVFATVFDRSIWLHESAVTDYVCYVINAILGSLLRIGGFVVGAVTSILLFELLLNISGGEALSVAPSLLVLALYTLLSLLWIDLGKYAGHYLLHRLPVMWEFHKVHHSAQVLTPITLFRIHPCEFLLSDFMSGIFVGTSAAVGLFVFGSQVQPLTILGLNAGLFLFYALGANLRHSHVWLPYPGWLSRILISPAQHQIHHSSLPQHHDANFGVLFALWDWIFGTLYVPKERENLVFGLHEGEDHEYQSLAGLYVLPFKKIWARWFGPRRPPVEEQGAA